jgi:uncharacterized damage-inducible protein DinB
MMDAMSDSTMGAKAAEGHRNLGHVAWHIVTSIPEMMQRTGLPVSAVDPQSPPPATAGKIAAAYRAVSEELARAVEKNWTDATLEKTDEMYGETWARGRTLAVLMGHETHHRGQMTVLLRIAGARVPGLMGPSKEEWAEYGMQAPPY